MTSLGKNKPVPTANGITLEEAHLILMAARKKAEDIGVRNHLFGTGASTQ
ncbi:MAG: hypothetical protein V7K46_13230 [Nostoc sp.]